MAPYVAHLIKQIKIKSKNHIALDWKMRIKYNVLYLIIILLWALPALATPKIIWYANLSEQLKSGSGFWDRTYLFIVAAAQDLGVELKIYYFNDDHWKMLQQVQESLSSPKTRPDAIMFHNHKGVGKQILKIAEKFKVKALVFNSGIRDESLGRPREKFKYWIGELLPDDEYAGRLLADELIRDALRLKKRGTDKKVHMIGIEGNRASSANIARKNGLKRALEKYDQVLFTQFISAEWLQAKARTSFKPAIKRYPEISIFWAASDSMGLGIIEGAKNAGWKPGKDFVTGGIDLTPEGIQAVQDGNFSATIGGHYVDGAWAVILLYDYLNSHDFIQNGSTTLKTQMAALTSANIGQYIDIEDKLNLDNIQQKIDFKQYSKTWNPELKSYVFNAGKLLGNL